MKRLIMLLFVIVLLFTSCSLDQSNFRSKQLSSLMNEEKTKIEQMSNDIIDCFTKKDKKALKNLFCEQIRRRPGFDKELDKAFAYFKCDGYTDSYIDTSASGGESLEKGKRTSWDVRPDIPYISVYYFNGKKPSADIEDIYYSMHYYWHIINKEDPTLEGLQYIEIERLNVDSIILGKQLG